MYHSSDCIARMLLSVTMATSFPKNYEYMQSQPRGWRPSSVLAEGFFRLRSTTYEKSGFIRC